MKRNEIALTLYTVRDFCQTEKDLLHTLNKIKKIGYNAIQVSSIGPINPREIKKMCDDIGLTICATHEPNEKIINNTDLVIEKLNTLNCSYTALPYPKNMNFLDLNILDKFIEDINIAGSIFSKANKVLCYHNHALEFQKINNEIILERIYNNTDNIFIQGEPDVYWIQKGGHDPISWCKKLKNRLPLIHLKDFIMLNEHESYYAEIGNGNLDIKNIIKEAEISGCKWYIVEQDECQEDPFISIETSFNNLLEFVT